MAACVLVQLTAIALAPGFRRFGRVGNAQMVAEPAINAPPPTLAPPAKKRLNVRIDDTWYDLTNWRAAHPACMRACLF